jgi:hypothetical protein
VAAVAFEVRGVTPLLAHAIRKPAAADPDSAVSSVVIPNWNGRELREKYLPSVVENARKIARNSFASVSRRRA